jgi:transposase
MLDQEKVMELKILNKQGQSMKAIARVSGAARNTVRKYVRDSATALRKPRISRLDPHRDWLLARLGQSPGIPASVLLRELHERGCDVSGARLRDVVAKLRPRATALPVVRFETAPGVQAQVDFATMSFGEFSFKLFVAVLGYSRWLFALFVPDERVESLREGHISLFDRLGGVPHKILYDNPRTVVIERDPSDHKKHRFHPALWELVGHYGFAPTLCKPYRPQTKGKVERMVRYLRENFFLPTVTHLIANKQALTLTLLNAELNRWLTEVANVRIHRHTKARPVDRLLEEATKLLPLPQVSQGKTVRAQIAEVAIKNAASAIIVRESASLQRPLDGYQAIQNLVQSQLQNHAQSQSEASPPCN